MRDATRAELRAAFNREIVERLARFLDEVYKLAAPETPDAPAWDPPHADGLDGGGEPTPETYDPLDKAHAALGEAEFYRQRYEAALAHASKLYQYASERDDLLQELELDDHVATLDELSAEAKRLREDLGL